MKAKRTDANQTEIVEALIRSGCMVQSLAMVGCGTPDLLWIRDGRIGLMEVKDGSKPEYDRKLTEAEVKWAKLAKAHGYVVPMVVSVRQALDEISSDHGWEKTRDAAPGGARAVTEERK